MTYYKLHGVINRREIEVKKVFRNETDAIHHMFKLYHRAGYPAQVDRIREYNNTNEYICDDLNKFFIRKVTI